MAKNIPSDNIKKIFADLPSFSHPSIITGELFRPDLQTVLTKDNTMYILKLTVGYETNLRSSNISFVRTNINCKHAKYKELIEEQKKKFASGIFINLSISALGVFDEEVSEGLSVY